MVTHNTKYHKNTYLIKWFKEYHDKILTRAELYNDKGQLIFLKDEYGNQRFYWNEDKLLRIRFADGVEKIFIEFDLTKGICEYYYKYPNGRVSNVYNDNNLPRA